MSIISVLAKYWVLLIVTLLAAWATGADMRDIRTVGLLVGCITVFYAVYTYLIYKGTQKRIAKEEAANKAAGVGATKPGEAARRKKKKKK